MAITYSWEFPTLDVIYNEDDPKTGEPVQDVVTTVHWIYTANDGEYTASTYSTVNLPAPGQPFVSYEDLTPAIVQGWVEEALGPDQLADIELTLANKIEEQKQPKGGSMTPPWQQ